MITHARSTGTDTAAEDAAAPGGVGGWVLRSGVERALRLQHPLVSAHVAAVRRKNPEMSPAEVVDRLGRQYRIAVAGTGAAGGAVAIIPALGTVASLATAGAEAFAALDAAVIYTLAVAEVHALPTDEPERRRALVLGVVVGAGGQAVLRKVTGRSHDWAREVTDNLPLARLGLLNNGLTRWFVKRYIIRQGVLALGRALPLGIGVVIGAVGNLVTARAVIRSAEIAFGSPPASWRDAGNPKGSTDGPGGN
ncbi:hypothetical protein [Pseudonocardia humida]|uniref:EcsC family protein n=1 Tax=Pseudonocardia humida TaxID=2800819 RepID=A0ABT1AA67_9PSEU|nr:hypothetical protein [Pseudonocardia humida]MCO1659841.1 hypothetical protein [Pseudonocardia humida]